MENEKTTIPSLRVLRIIARLNIGGPAIHTLLLSRYMQRLGYETLLVAGQVGPQEGNMAYLAEAEGVQPIVLGKLGRRLQTVDDLNSFFRILRLLFTFRPHIVHTHTAKAGALGRLAALIYNKAHGTRHKAKALVSRIIPGDGPGEPKRLGGKDGCKIVHTYHGHVLHGYFSPLPSKFFQFIEKMLAKITDAVAVVSEQQKGELCEKYGIGHKDQYHIIPLGLDLEPFGQQQLKGTFRQQLGLGKEDTKLVGIVGRLTPIKNHTMFLEATKMLTNMNRQHKAHFLIVGDGESRKDLENMVTRLNLANPVVFTGWIRDLAPLYADLDVLALTSDNEGTPVAVIEAMAARVPVIATDVGGVRELISDRGFRISDLSEGKFEICERGVLVKKGDVRGFAKGLKYLFENPKKGREMGRRGQKYASQNHSVERLVADMDRLYKSLLSAGDK